MNDLDSDGYTPLHQAVLKEDVKMVRALLNSEQCLEGLSIKSTKENWTAWEIAKDKKNDALKIILKKAKDDYARELRNRKSYFRSVLKHFDRCGECGCGNLLGLLG